MARKQYTPEERENQMRGLFSSEAKEKAHRWSKEEAEASGRKGLETRLKDRKPSMHNAQDRQMYPELKEAYRQYMYAYSGQSEREEIIDLLGGKCSRCGFDDMRALQIDHINGGGNKERSCFGHNHQYYLYVRQRIYDGNQDYQVLCANCNRIKAHEDGIYGRKGR